MSTCEPSENGTSTIIKNDAGYHQLTEWNTKFHLPKGATTANGIPIDSLTNSLSVKESDPCAKCKGGYILLQDVDLVSNLASFNRERIPERVVHAKGAGAFGYFEVTADITKYTKAKVFEYLGKQTRIAVRFSQSAKEAGHPDTYRDARGFAMKFYTEEGNWDLVAFSTPMFFIRDPALFPHLNRSQKRNPVNNIPDADMYWDFITQRPETVHQAMYVFGDRGIPNGFRHMPGFGINTFSFVNAEGEVVYTRFHMRPDQGIENLSVELANELQWKDPDYFTRDLYSAIRSEDFPSWTFYVQIMTIEQTKTTRWDPFDTTKTWPQGDFPLIPVGKFVLNENPQNFFAQVEQMAFGPQQLVPGIEGSPDKVLQARMFAYPDTQRYRVGPNYLDLPVNRAKTVHSYNYSGPMDYKIPYEGPNYFPNTFNGYQEDPRGKTAVFSVSGNVEKYDTRDEDNFSQPRIFWEKCLKPDSRDRMVNNFADSITNAIPIIQDRCVSLFSKVHEDFGKMLKKALDDRRNK